MKKQLFTILFVVGVSFGQSWTPPAESARCPSKWGAGDQRGSGNLMKPDTVLRAARLIKTGAVIELGQVLSPEIPFFGNRRFDLFTKRTNVLPESNRRAANEELVVTELGQVGTQIDGFTHQSIGNSLYNCIAMDPLYLKGPYAGSDTMVLSAVPAEPYHCVELSGKNNVRPKVTSK